MIDFASARTKMVDLQLRTEGVTDADLLAAMGTVPREVFVPERMKALAYVDENIAYGSTGPLAGRYLIRPAALGRLIEAAEVNPTDVILDVGCGSGYATAVLARLGASVVGLECDKELAAAATHALTSLAAGNVKIVTGPLENGAPEDGPYDVILVEGAVEEAPESLLRQLRIGGRLVTVIGRGRAAQASVFTRSSGDTGERVAFDAFLPPLPGFEKPKAFVF